MTKVVTYYKKYTGKSNSIVDAFKESKISSSLENRKKIAKLNGIKDYTRTAKQNTKLLNLFKRGKLVKKISIKIIKTNAQKFVGYLNEIDITYDTYGSKINYGNNGIPSTYAEAKKLLKKNKKINSNCVAPIMWALKLLDINPNGFYGKNGNFVGFDADMKKKLTKISGKGYTVKQAVDKKYLRAGDICVFKNKTHTFAYTGKACLCFDGGHASILNEKYTGIIANYGTNSYKYCKLAYILRWK